MYVIERTRGKGSKTYMHADHWSPFKAGALELTREQAEAFVEGYEYQSKMVEVDGRSPRVRAKPKAKAKAKARAR